MNFFSFIFAVFLAFFSFVSPTLAFPVRIVHVVDGDTIDVKSITRDECFRIRLYGVDAPEKRQPGGEAATAFVGRFLFQIVDAEPHGKGSDKYGRTVATVHLPNGESLQAALLTVGLAWVWPQYCRNCQNWQSLQDEARLAGRGIWGKPNPIPPWEWRRNKKRNSE